jgi:2-dehydro-3-deoxygluconokinase
MTILAVRPAEECRYDAVSLGEVMLRLDPGEGRIRTARTFRVWEGGGEYNVTRGLCRAFGLRGAIITALADNEVGRLVEELILSGGLDTEFIRWLPYDGIGRNVRNGLNFTERGFGVRGAVGVSDRGHTAASQLRPGDIDWDHLFGELGVRWLHTGGIFAVLSESTAATTLEAVTAAKRHGTAVSYDFNYRPSLWRALGDRVARQQEVNREIARYVDVMIANKGDITASLGFESEGLDDNSSLPEADRFAALMETAAESYPNFAVVATTIRTVHNATINDWGAMAWSQETGVVQATHRERLEIMDRVGGGDAFASGLIYGLIDGLPLQTAVEYGAAHGALAMTTPGDTTMATKKEVLQLAGGGSSAVDR